MLRRHSCNVIIIYFAVRFVDFLGLEDVGGHKADGQGDQGEKCSDHTNVSEADD